MQTSLFDYDLPPDRIAQHSVEPRDQAKMLVLDRASGEINDQHILDLPNFLRPNDLIVLNNSKVFKARLRAKRGDITCEIFLLRPENERWIALAQPARKLSADDTLLFSDGTKATLIEKREDGTIQLDFQKSPEDVFALADRIGEVPTPPYVNQSKSTDEYQTIYAEKTGSVAAPTAGFHFTPRLFEALEKKGIKKAFVTLHVGLGTFRPMKSETLEEHVMHEEWIDVPEETKQLIEETKKNSGRVIAVGTTTVRALESRKNGFTNLFITLGYQFNVIDGLLTNFHLPKSTLLVLVSALAGREHILNAYQHAIQQDYRFYSFGDAMLILPPHNIPAPVPNDRTTNG
ncbi:tRNA preQ1(34) S-adenosylmethionine ribosyltransferase-isomerase QueA [Candidatus Uhrbacteria bacterium]|nr:tRNA preQ1(34) S-adenosylmethionine ribosyltransferase-isomerase QueA [Candidatus Uhrbacteria bacterium]